MGITLQHCVDYILFIQCNFPGYTDPPSGLSRPGPADFNDSWSWMQFIFFLLCLVVPVSPFAMCLYEEKSTPTRSGKFMCRQHQSLIWWHQSKGELTPRESFACICERRSTTIQSRLWLIRKMSCCHLLISNPKIKVSFLWCAALNLIRRSSSRLHHQPILSDSLHFFSRNFIAEKQTFPGFDVSIHEFEGLSVPFRV